MARFFNQNISVTTGNCSDLWYWFKQTALSAGWTMLQCGDGTTYKSDGTDLITPAKSLLANIWFLLQMPDGNRKLLVFHQGTADTAYWYVGYAATGSYNANGNATTPSTVNTAVEKAVFGTVGTRAAAQLGYTGYTYYLQVQCNDAAPYDFYALLTRQGTGSGVMTTFWGGEVDQPSASDTDPFVICNAYDNGGSCLLATYLRQSYSALNAYSSLGCRGYRDATNWVSFGLLSPRAVSVFCGPNSGDGVNGVGVNPYTQKDDLIPALVLRGVSGYADLGYKGMTSFLRWPMSVYRSGGTLLTMNSVGDWICYGNVALPWNNAVPRV